MKIRHTVNFLGRAFAWLVSLSVLAASLVPAAVLAQTDGVIWHRISHDLAENDDVRLFEVSPDRRYAVYISGDARNFLDDLYSVPIQGGTPVPLNPPLSGFRQVAEFRISPDSQRVVYIADQDEDNVFELYSVPIQGGAVTKSAAPWPARVYSRRSIPIKRIPL